MRSAVVQLVKWGWIAVVLAVAGSLVHAWWGDIEELLRRVSLPLVLGAVLLTALAKAGLAENARLAAARVGLDISFADAARLYNLSQLGKYLPGSIWQFVGRAAAYRNRGGAYGQIRDALVLESLWIVAGASLVALLLVGPQLPALLGAGARHGLVPWVAGLGVVGLVLLATAWVARRELARHYLLLAFPTARVAAVQGVIWTVLGLAFWTLATACAVDVPVAAAAGLFAAGYALGFLVPFAPAGLGVRDAVLTIGLMPFAPGGEAIAVTLLARLVYLVVDVGLAVLQEPAYALVERRRAGRG